MLLLPRTGVSQGSMETVHVDGQDRSVRTHAGGVLQFIREDPTILNTNLTVCEGRWIDFC